MGGCRREKANRMYKEVRFKLSILLAEVQVFLSTTKSLQRIVSHSSKVMQSIDKCEDAYILNKDSTIPQYSIM